MPDVAVRGAQFSERICTGPCRTSWLILAAAAVIAQARRHVADTPHALLQGQHISLARCVAAGMQEAAQHAEPQPTPAADIAPDVAEAAAAAAFELPVHPIQPLPVAPAQATAAAEAHESDARSDDDGFEFGSDAASDSSSSWTSSDEDTGDPLTSASLPAWLARRTAGGRCAMAAGGCCAVPSLTAPRRIVTWTTTMMKPPHA